MPTSQRSRRSPVAVAAGVVALAAALAGCGGGSSAGAGGPVAQITQVAGPPQVSSRYPGALLLNAVPMPAITLTDTSGQPYDLATAATGKVTLLYFGYTHCPDVCPIDMALTAKAVGMLDPAQRAKVDVVFVTTDPDRDTPPVIRTWLDGFAPGFVGLTGSITQIHQAESDLQLPLSMATMASTASAGAYEVEHAGFILGFDRAGRTALQLDDSITATDYATSIRHLLTAT